MIIDSLRNAEKYYVLHPLFKEAFDYLNSTDFVNSALGKVSLKGEDLFVIVSDSDMKEDADAQIEVHNRYIDIQLPVSKSETFGWAARSALKKENTPFDDERDIQFYKDEKVTHFTLIPGNFVVFFPEDGHAPCIGEGVIRKVVVKIKL